MSDLRECEVQAIENILADRETYKALYERTLSELVQADVKVNKYGSLVEKMKKKKEECIKDIENDEKHDEWGYEHCKIQVLQELLDTVEE